MVPSPSQDRSRAGIARRVSETERLTLGACGDIGEGKTIKRVLIRLNDGRNMHFPVVLTKSLLVSVWALLSGFAKDLLHVSWMDRQVGEAVRVDSFEARERPGWTARLFAFLRNKKGNFHLYLIITASYASPSRPLIRVLKTALATSNASLFPKISLPLYAPKEIVSTSRVYLSHTNACAHASKPARVFTCLPAFNTQTPQSVAASAQPDLKDTRPRT